MAHNFENKSFVSVDYLTVTVPVSKYNSPYSIVQNMINIIRTKEPDVDFGAVSYSERGLYTYKKSFTLPHYFTVLFENGNKAEDTICLQISGEGMNRLCHDQKEMLKKALQNIGFRCSRIDFAFTDFDRILPVSTILSYFKAWLKDDVMVAVRTKKQRKGVKIHTTYSGGIVEGLVFGSRQSECLVRLYDKRVESHLDVPYCYRLEYELHRQDASRYYDAWLKGSMNEEQVFNDLLRHVFALVDKVDTNISRATINATWGEFLELFNAIMSGLGVVRQKIYFATIKTTQKIIRNVERNSAQLLVYFHLLQGDLTRLFELGQEKAERHCFYRQYVAKDNPMLMPSKAYA